MAIYLLKQCDECGIVMQLPPTSTTIGTPWTCPICQIKKREGWIGEIVEAVRAGYKPQIGGGLVDLAKASYEELKIEAGRVWSWYNAGAPVEKEPQTGGQVVGGGANPVPTDDDPQCAVGAPVLAHLTPAEVQSGYDRLQHATGLILQLPRSHDGRNTWLMNYATHKDPDVQAAIRACPRLCGASHASANRGTVMAACRAIARPEDDC